MGFLTDIGPIGNEIRDVFVELVCEYANLRGYVADRYGDRDPDIIGWLRSKPAVYVDPQSVPDAAAWEDRFWTAFTALRDLVREERELADETTQHVYEEALAEGETWAVEAYEQHDEEGWQRG